MHGWSVRPTREPYVLSTKNRNRSYHEYLPIRPVRRPTHGLRPLDDGIEGPDRIVSARGGRYPLRLPRRRYHPRLRRALRLPRPSAPHPRAPRAGRRTRRTGLRPGQRPRRGLPRNLRPRRHEHRDGAGRRADGLHAAGARHRAGRLDAAGDRRLPGDQFRRHHAGRHQMELPGQAHRRHSRGHRQGLLHRPFGPSGSRRGRHHEGRTVRNSPVPLRKNHLDPQLPPLARTRCGTHRPGRTADRRGPPSAGHGGSGRHPGQRRSRAAGAARQERHARRLDPAGPLGPADRPSAKRGHAGHARQLRTQHQKPGVRPARGRGHALRRPRDGEPGSFRRQRQGDPPGDRPCGDRQDHPGRRGGRGRRETLPAAPHRAYPQTRPQRMDRRVQDLRQDRIRSRHPQGRAPRRGAYPHGRGGRRSGPGLP